MNINIEHENYAQCKFYVYLSTDVTADAASCWTLAAFILTLQKNEPKIWMHIKQYLSSAKAIPIQEAQKLRCVDTAASNAENLKWYLTCYRNYYSIAVKTIVTSFVSMWSVFIYLSADI